MAPGKRILLVSLGSIGRRHLRNIKTLMPGAELCVWRHKPGPAPAEARGLQVVHTAADALAFAPDAVLVSSPAAKHAAQCSPFAERGVPIFVEKPLETSVDKLAGLEAALQRGQGLLFVGYVLRFQPIMAFLKDALASGCVGEIRTAQISTGQYLPDWRPGSDYRDGVSARADLGGGVLLELSHELDYARWFFGHPRSVTAETARLSGLEMDVEDHASIILGYDQRQITVSVDFLQRVPCMTLKVVGSAGTLHADLIEETAVIATPDGQQDLTTPKMEAGNDMYLCQFDAFLDRAFDDYVPQYDASEAADFARFEDARAVLELVDAARQSSLSGKRVSL
ncbi:Gfo/Idh/MocA family oxidoreductase [uncultured Roseobacter sp.]|uniref:Gfo/Idh/MocA family protein n=1 Tax=uncultured Roseobacter sp. TaxID=114847 RepID=UPI0026384B22|nr:Gfo/Idh/MocA family oxidoreductase [uncultured Roseobacter sp.]